MKFKKEMAATQKKHEGIAWGQYTEKERRFYL